MRTFRSFFILNALLTLLLIFPSFSQGFEAPEEIFTTSTASSRKATVCLNMIVKDEKDVILRCLESVLPLIDYWVIVDTGSTDGTQELIVDFMNKKGVPGDLYERPWVNFGHNRNEALNLARNEADYLLFIDADEYLKFDPDFKTPDLKEDFYYLTVKYGGSAYSRVGLTKMSLDWRWKGVLHEALYSDRAAHS